jgi:hypothetical protein
MFMDTDLKHDITIKPEQAENKKPFKPNNKQIFVGYKDTKKKSKSKK